MKKLRKVVKREGKKKVVREMTLGLVVSWIFGVLFGLSGISFLFDGMFIAGISLILASLVLLPPVNKQVEKEFDFKLSGALKIVTVMVLFLIYASNVEIDESVSDCESGYYFDKDSNSCRSYQQTTAVYESDTERNTYVSPYGEYYENTKGGFTLIIDDLTFEKRSETYGILKDLTFILRNEQGSATIMPDLRIFVLDKEDKKYDINKEIDLSEWIQDGDSIRRSVSVDLGVASIKNPKTIKVHLVEWRTIINTVSFDIDLSESKTLG